MPAISTIPLQPQRVPLGFWTDASGRQVPIIIAREWYQGLTALAAATRAGGDVTQAELDAVAAAAAEAAAALTATTEAQQAEIDALAAEISALPAPATQRTPPVFFMDDAEHDFAFPGPPGAPGVAGVPGAAGSAGPGGFSLDGEPGEDGLTIPGPQGPQGAVGPAGSSGGPPPVFFPESDGGDEGIFVPGQTGPAGTPGSSGVGAFCNGRLTLTTGVPVPTTDVTGATTVYFTPYSGNLISLWDGAAWSTVAFTEKSIALGTVTAFTAYDVFGYLSAGTLAIESLAWLNAAVTFSIASPCIVTWNAHGMSNGDPVVFTTTGAVPTGISQNFRYFVQSVTANTFRIATTLGGADVNTSGTQSGTHTGWQSRQRGTAVTLQDGRYCKSGDKTRLYLGTFLTTSTTATESSRGGTTTQVGGKRFVWNYYNRIDLDLAVKDTTDSWSYTNTTIRQANGAVGNKVEAVIGITEDAAFANAMGTINVNAAGSAFVGVGFDTLTAVSGTITAAFSTNNTVQGSQGQYRAMLPIGYHFMSWNEAGATGTACTFLGDNGTATQYAGLTASIKG